MYKEITRWVKGDQINITCKPTPFGSDRAKEIITTARYSDFEAIMTDGEIAHTMDVQGTMGDTASFLSALYKIRNEPVSVPTVTVEEMRSAFADESGPKPVYVYDPAGGLYWAINDIAINTDHVLLSLRGTVSFDITGPVIRLVPVTVVTWKLVRKESTYTLRNDPRPDTDYDLKYEWFWGNVAAQKFSSEFNLQDYEVTLHTIHVDSNRVSKDVKRFVDNRGQQGQGE